MSVGPKPAQGDSPGFYANSSVSGEPVQAPWPLGRALLPQTRCPSLQRKKWRLRRVPELELDKGDPVLFSPLATTAPRLLRPAGPGRGVSWPLRQKRGQQEPVLKQEGAGCGRRGPSLSTPPPRAHLVQGSHQPRPLAMQSWPGGEEGACPTGPVPPAVCLGGWLLLILSIPRFPFSQPKFTGQAWTIWPPQAAPCPRPGPLPPPR